MLLALLGIFALLVPGAHAGSDKPRPKPRPDLVIASARMGGPPYAFEGEQSPLSYTAVTRNAGRVAAGASVTGLVLREDVDLPSLEGVRLLPHRVPALRPVGDPRHRNRHRGGDPGPVEIRGLELGRYQLMVCADLGNRVKESNEQNNCETLAKLYVLTKRRWSGQVGGHGNIGAELDATEAWSGDLAFKFKQYLAGGVFLYEVTSVNVTFEDTGSSANYCTYSGGGTATSTIALSRLVLDYGKESYKATAQTPYAYTITLSCPGLPPDHLPGPQYQVFLLMTNQLDGGLPLPFGTDVLKGTFSDGGTEFHWKFD